MIAGEKEFADSDVSAGEEIILTLETNDYAHGPSSLFRNMENYDLRQSGNSGN